ncbi:hypothetical protein Sjap_002667 [Stephania japonica]|uniref:Uncharacterized protein n=1 Tax=Stephania japonica TaxID=461633 RepID=A0AAP0KMA3_9MAGN
MSYTGYVINEQTFRTKSAEKSTQDSSVSILAAKACVDLNPRTGHKLLVMLIIKTIILLDTSNYSTKKGLQNSIGEKNRIYG